LLFLIFLFFCLGLFPAFIAHGKRRPFVLWWLYGTLLFLIALPHALLLNSNTLAVGERIRPGEKICPYCHESVPEEDEVCPSCHLRLYDPAQHGPPISS
jgi:hypothetical protein